MFINTVRDYIPPFKCAEPLSPMDTFRDEQIHRTAIQTQRDDGNPFIRFDRLRTLRDCTSSLDPIGQIPLQIRQRFTDFAFLKRGMEGCLWTAVDTNSNNPSVIKIYHQHISPSLEVLERILNIDHLNVIKLREWGEAKGHLYEIMEELSGGSLQDMLFNGPMHEANLRKVLGDIAQALKVLHAVSIIHGDVKPENILWGSLCWKLGDFGISVLHDEDTLSRRVGRTPGYCAPEVEAGNLSFASDFWSLGVSIFQALTDIQNAREWSVWSGYESLKFQWKELFDGLFQESIALRWGSDEISNWILVQEKKISSSLDGSDIRNLSDLAREIALRWYEMTAMIRNNTFHEWLSNELSRFDVPTNIVSNIESNDPDIYLLRILYRLDPNISPVYKEWAISDHNLKIIANKAMDKNISSFDILQELYQKNILAELASLANNRELQFIHDVWVRDVDSYYAGVSWVTENEGNTSIFNHSTNIATLYLTHKEELPVDILWEEPFSACVLWINYLIDLSAKNNGYKLVAYLATRDLYPQFENHFKLYYGATLSGITGSRVAKRNILPAPVAAFRALPTLMQMYMCEGEVTLAHRIRLSWNVTGAIVRYITGIGFVGPEGAIDITVGSNRELTLSAFGLTGMERVKIMINFPSLTLPQQAKWNGIQNQISTGYLLADLSPQIELDELKDAILQNSPLLIDQESFPAVDYEKLIDQMDVLRDEPVLLDENEFDYYEEFEFDEWLENKKVKQLSVRIISIVNSKFKRSKS